MTTRPSTLGFLALWLAAAQGTAAPATETAITFNGRTALIRGAGAHSQGSVVTIRNAGTYRLSGQFDNGQLVVDTPDQADVRLILDSVRLQGGTNAPLLVRRAERVVLELPAGSSSVLGDAAGGAIDRPNAVIASREDLSITGSGALQINALHRDGIDTKDGLKIQGGTLHVTATGDALVANDQLTISGGTLNLQAGGGSGQGIHAGVQGKQFRGRFATAQAAAKGPSRKGLKAGTNIEIRGGTIRIDAADDALNSNDAIRITGGQLRIASGDDAIHAEKTLRIDGGDVVIERSYEGLEAPSIAVNGGRVQLTASDDGISISTPARNWIANRAGVASPSAIRGGQVFIDAGGDGLDSDGSIEITGGTVIVNGPVANMDGALDADGGVRVSGGTLIAAGSAGMAQAAASNSTQPSVRLYLPETVPAGTALRLRSSSGTVVMNFAPAKSIQSLVFSSAELRQGETYVLEAAGSEIQRFTQNGMVTTVGTGGRGTGGRGFRRGF